MQPQRGNILFLILLAVVLFAALSYAVTNSMRGGGKDSGSENASLYAATLSQYGSLVTNSMTRLQLINNCSDTEFDFANDIWVRRITQAPTIPSTQNPNRRSDGSCSLFDISGAGLAPQIFEKASMAEGLLNDGANSYVRGSGLVGSGALKDIGTDDPEILLFIGLVSDNVCKEINKRNGYDSDDIPIIVTTSASSVFYNGNFSAITEFMTGGGGDSDLLIGMNEFCYKHSPSGWSDNGINYYVRAILER